MKNQRGITLIALVITIIVLIILAGVAINLTLGENGILRRAEQSKESYNLAKEKEALEIEIMEVQVEILETEGRNATLNDLQNKIDTSKYTIELHFEPLATTENVTSVPTYAIVNRINTMYYFTVDRKLVITDVELAEPPTKYIKFSEITWENGKASITLSTTEAGTIEYKIGEDGTYQEGTTIENLNHADVVYARINRNGQYTEEETKIIYDAVEPEEFEITVPEDAITYESFTITSTGTEDKQSGIRDYAFVVTKDETVVQEIKNQEVTEYTIKGVSPETEYVVYMLAYDNAGNVRKSNEVKITTLPMPVAKMIGQYVNYGKDIDGDGNTTNDWQIFYKEEDTTSLNYGATYIIPDYFVPASFMPTSLSNAGMALASSSYTYRIKWPSLPSFVTISNAARQVFMFDYTVESAIHMKSVSKLLNTSAWESDFVTTELKEKGGMAIGGPTTKLWSASWNKVYPTEKITVAKVNDGYEVNGSDTLNLVGKTGYKNAPNVYFPTKGKASDGAEYYWLASPSSNSNSSLGSITSSGMIFKSASDSSMLGLRPVVYIPASVTLEPSGTANLWNINYGTTNN